jgi:hypothetical protein
MCFLDSDLRGPLADYTFHARRGPPDGGSPSTHGQSPAKRSTRLSRVLRALAHPLFSETRRVGEAR